MLCPTQRAAGKPEVHEVILDERDGLEWAKGAASRALPICWTGSLEVDM